MMGAWPRPAENHIGPVRPQKSDFFRQQWALGKRLRLVCKVRQQVESINVFRKQAKGNLTAEATVPTSGHSLFACLQ